MERNRCLFIVLFAIPTTVVLLQYTGICGWGCPKITPAWQLWYKALSSASAAEATTNHMIVMLT
jgi:hypothetical protein